MKESDLLDLKIKVTELRAEGKYQETIEEAFRLLELASEVNDFNGALVAHLNQAVSYYSIGAIEEAFRSMDAYREICREYGDETDHMNLYNILFLLYNITKDTKKAKETLEKTIELGRRLQHFNIVSNACSNMSHVLMEEGNYGEALTLAEAGLENARLHEPQSAILEFRVKLNIAKSLLGLKDYTRSKKMLDEMLPAPFLSTFPREQAQCLDLQGAWLTEQKRYREAFDSYTAAKEVVETYGDVHLMRTIQEARCKLCELMDDVELGYVVQKEYITLLNEISRRELELAAQKLEIKHSAKDFKYQANIDFLTGLYNRSYLEHTADEWLTHAAVNDESIVCIAFDIDNFKTINDTFGHLFGDEVIQHVGNVCTEVFRKEDLVGRYGGDEFVILLKDASLETGERKARQLRAALEKIELFKDSNQLNITISIGVSANEEHTINSFKTLFHLADTRLYKAKQNGKNQVFAG